MFTDRRLIIAMAVFQGVTMLCALFVAVRVAQVNISYGQVDAVVEIRGQPIDVRIQGQPIEVKTAR